MPDHDALEVQVTALLLGELSAAEARTLRARIEADPALRTLHDRLRIAIELTREATRPPQAKELPRPNAPRLDAARRDHLLAKLRTPAAPAQPDIIPLPTAAPSAGSASRRTSNRREWLAMAAMLVVLLATAGGVRLFRRDEARQFASAPSGSQGLNEFAWNESASGSADSRLELRRQSAPASSSALSVNAPASPTPLPASGPVAAPSDPRPVTRFALQPEGRSSPALEGRLAESARDRFDDAKKDGKASDSTAQFRSLTTSTARDVAVPAKPETDDLLSSAAARYEGASAGGVPALGYVPAPGALSDSPAPVEKSLKEAGAVTTTGNAAGAGEKQVLARTDHLYRTPRSQGSFELKASLRGFYDDNANGRVDGLSDEVGAKAGLGGFGGGAKANSRSYQYAPGTAGGSSPSQSHWHLSNGTVTPAEPQRDLARNLADSESEVREDIVQQSLREQDKAPARPGVALVQKQEARSEMDTANDFFVPAETRAKITANFFTDPALGQVESFNKATAEKLEKLPAANAPVQLGLGFGNAPPPVELRGTDEFGTVAPAGKSTELPALAERLAKNGLAENRELGEVQLATRSDFVDRSVAPKSRIDAVEVFSVPAVESKQHDINGDVTSPKPEDAARDKTLGGLVVQEGARTKLSLLEVAAKAKADMDADGDQPVPPPTPPAPVPQPEVQTATDPFSTFSLNVSDVSFQLAAASLEQGALPAPGSIRTEEFINAFDYRDPMPVGNAPVAFAWERARDAFAHNRDLLRFSIKTAATGREATKPLNIVLLVDNSGSMERADRVRIRHECLRILASQLQPQDRISVVTFARTARLAADGIPGNQAGALADQIGSLTPEGGTHLEGALDLAYQTARRHFSPTGINRVVLLTDGAANLGDVSPDSLRRRVEDNRRQGVALDCFGIGWEGLNDDLLESLSRNGDGRYGFINTPEAATANFAAQLAGALQVAASDVKVQVEFNPLRVTTHRQVGYARHQLKKEQFRDNTVDAAELAAAEAGNALYVVQSNPAGSGPIATVRVRFKVPGTADYREQSWEVPYEGSARALDQSSPALRLASVASNFAEWLAQSPHAAEVTPDRLLPLLNGIPQSQPGDPRPARLESMIRQARSIGGR
jgi:Mg-chelatase subunit ChlD